MKVLNNTFRGWLVQHNYQEIAELVDSILIEWRNKGIKTRRNWWDILAGDKKGNPRIISGRRMPVLKAAQVRQGVRVSENALCNDENELSSIPDKKC